MSTEQKRALMLQTSDANVPKNLKKKKKKTKHKQQDEDLIPPVKSTEEEIGMQRDKTSNAGGAEK